MAFSEAMFELGLTLSRSTFTSIILIGGYIFINRKVFALVITLYLYSLSVVFYIKNLFRIPLNADIFGTGAGWAFPSGHTATMSIILIYICAHYRKTWVWVLAGACFITTCLSMMHFHFHNSIEIVGGMLVAITLVGVVVMLRFLMPVHKYAEAGIILGLNCWQASVLPYPDGHWLWFTLSIAISFYLGWILFECSRNRMKYLTELSLFLIPLAVMLTKDMQLNTMQCLIRGAVVGFWIGYILPTVYFTNKNYLSIIGRKYKKNSYPISKMVL